MIQRELGTIFLHQGKNMFNNALISVVNVRVSPDLGHVKVFLSFFNEKEPEKLCNLINSYTKEIRTLLAARIKNQVKKIPELMFYYDDSKEYTDKMDEIFKKIEEEKKQNDNNQDNK